MAKVHIKSEKLTPLADFLLSRSNLERSLAIKKSVGQSVKNIIKGIDTPKNK